MSYHGVAGGVRTSRGPRNKWIVVCSPTQVETSGDEPKTWEECKEALSRFDFSVEEQDKILGKAFGHIHSPYWTEERVKENPKVEALNHVLEFLRSLGLSDEDLHKVLKKFPEVLGCSLEEEMKGADEKGKESIIIPLGPTHHCALRARASSTTLTSSMEQGKIQLPSPLHTQLFPEKLLKSQTCCTQQPRQVPSNSWRSEMPLTGSLPRGKTLE